MGKKVKVTVNFPRQYFSVNGKLQRMKKGTVIEIEEDKLKSAGNKLSRLPIEGETVEVGKKDDKKTDKTNK